MKLSEGLLQDFRTSLTASRLILADLSHLDSSSVNFRFKDFHWLAYTYRTSEKYLRHWCDRSLDSSDLAPSLSSRPPSSFPSPFFSLTMLEQLPNELLQSILLHIGPPFWDEYDDDRHNDLSSLSLVSKRLRTFAQPLLFSVLTLQVWPSAKLLLEYESTTRCRELVSSVRFIRCESPGRP